MAGRVFDDTMTPENLSGLCVTIGAIAGYNYVKLVRMREDVRMEVHILHHHPREEMSDAEEDEMDDEQRNGEVGKNRRKSVDRQEDTSQPLIRSSDEADR
jgi:hypothetical protein